MSSKRSKKIKFRQGIYMGIFQRRVSVNHGSHKKKEKKQAEEEMKMKMKKRIKKKKKKKKK